MTPEEAQRRANSIEVLRRSNLEAVMTSKLENLAALLIHAGAVPLARIGPHVPESTGSASSS